MSKLFVYAILSSLFVLISCTNDTNPSQLDEGKEVAALIKLELPDMQLPAITKAAEGTNKENLIDDLYLYVFDQSNKLIDQVKATIPNNEALTKAVTANLNATKEPVTLIALANMDTNGLMPEFSKGTAKSEFLKSLVFDAQGQDEELRIPMWGECSLPNGIYTDDEPILISMTRALASVEVLVDTKLVINFDLDEVWLLGTYDKGYVTPIDNNGNLQKGKISIPADADGGEREIGSAYYKEGLSNTGVKFYVPESKLKKTLSNDNLPLRSLCVIIGGNTTIDGETQYSYYRLDLLLENTKDEELEITRNTRYIYKINAVHAFGTESPKAALDKSIPDNASRAIDATKVMVVGGEATEKECIEKGLNDITTDGTDYIAVNSSTLEAKYNSENKMYYAKIQIYTNYSGGWKMIDMPEGIIAQQKTGEAKVFYETFIWIEPKTTNPLFYIMAGGVWKTITITGVQ